MQAVGDSTVADLIACCREPRSRCEIQAICSLIGRENFRLKYVKPLLDKGLLKMTIPGKPTSRNQKYYS
ncbi:Fic family protein [Ruminococcus sp.]|uniref:Fic family protein n=1 Tax=Ruminococcus sp. TaxID=41978 RepID=UPI0034559072